MGESGQKENIFGGADGKWKWSPVVPGTLGTLAPASPSFQARGGRIIFTALLIELSNIIDNKLIICTCTIYRRRLRKRSQ